MGWKEEIEEGLWQLLRSLKPDMKFQISPWFWMGMWKDRISDKLPLFFVLCTQTISVGQKYTRIFSFALCVKRTLYSHLVSELRLRKDLLFTCEAVLMMHNAEWCICLFRSPQASLHGCILCKSYMFGIFF